MNAIICKIDHRQLHTIQDGSNKRGLFFENWLLFLTRCRYTENAQKYLNTVIYNALVVGAYSG